MPSSMIHLIAAHKFNSNGSTEYLIGNLAPDSISQWEEKDRVHLRRSENRLEDYKNLLRSKPLDNDVNFGIMLHLYLDLVWDQEVMRIYIDDYGDGNWFVDYREEIGKASSWLYHKYTWSKEVWDRMSDYDYRSYSDDFGFEVNEVIDLVARNHKWHGETRYDAIGHFDEILIDDITTRAVDGFKLLILEIG